MNKGLSTVITVICIALLLGVGGAYYYLGHAKQQPLVGADKDIHGCIGSAGYSWCDIKQKCLRTWEEPCSVATNTPTVDETTTLITAVKQAIIAEHGSDANTLSYTVSKITGDYAQGGASAQGGGAMWFAAKVNGAWKLVWDGNGVILCKDIASYPDFPKSMIPECYNNVTNKNITR